jgi:glycosyltransferase involved in cell wall biosynthesis
MTETVNQPGRKKILLVAMPDSIHVARWLAANSANNLDVMIFASSPMRRVHPRIRRMLSNRNEDRAEFGLNLKAHELSFLFAIPLWIVDRPFLFGGRVRGLLISRAISSFKPDLVHTMESQNGGYSSYQALKNNSNERRPKTLLTLFGSDLFWFSRFEYHQRRLRELLKTTDFLQAECARDETLAKGLGFSGEFLPLLPVSAGIPSESLLELADFDEISSRKVIAIKGYAGQWGLAKKAIDTLGEISSGLTGYTLELYSCDPKVAEYARSVFRGTGVAVKAHPKFTLSHEQMLELFRRSRVAIAFSRSDGLPASMLEAMSQGAFPVQTSSACVDGWFDDGVSGLVVNEPGDSSLAPKLKQVIESSELLSAAARQNSATIHARYSDQAIANSASQIYKAVLQNRNL